MIGPLFSTKSTWMAQIFLDSYVKGPIFLTSWYVHIFFGQRFFEAAYPLGITWIDCDICLTTSRKWVQKIKGQYMNRSTFWMIKYINGSVFSKVRYMNGVRFEILARTPLPKLTLSYPAPEVCMAETVNNSAPAPNYRHKNFPRIDTGNATLWHD